MNAKNGPGKGRSAITYTDPQATKIEVSDRLAAISSLSAYALLGMLPQGDVLEANVRLADRAALYLRAVPA